MKKLTQNQTPYLDALKKYVSTNVSSFDVPGHHLGNVSNDLKTYLGDELFKADVNAPIGMDNLSNPTGVLLQAHQLMSEFCGSKNSFFLINGTSSGIIAMIMSTCKANDKIILPRNVHKSIINALILSGIIPIYIMPNIDNNIQIANQPSIEDYKKAIQRHPSAKAILVINPTYFGAVNDLKTLVDIAHQKGVAVLVDEAHGAHYYFDDNGPISAMKAGADISSVSFHKTGGSLTQSSVLLLNSNIITRQQIQKSLNILTTTSPSTILLASIDAARKYAATKGQENMQRVHKLSDIARKQISTIKGFITYDKQYFIEHGCYDYDETKLIIGTTDLSISGFELYKLLKNEYNIQLELSEQKLVLGILAIGTKKSHIDHLISALKDISKKYYKKGGIEIANIKHSKFPFQLLSPRVAFRAPGTKVKLDDAVNEISNESIMMYPPGIPLIVPGEVFTSELINKIKQYKKLGVTLLSDNSKDFVGIVDRKNWSKFYMYQNRLDNYINQKMTTPSLDEYSMPFEGNEHQGTIICIPYRKDTWRNSAEPALEEFKNIIFAISKYEKVYVCIHPSIYKKTIPHFIDKENIVPIKIKYNDAWARDISPLFLTNKNKVRTVDFRFNSWGGSVDGLYSNYLDDDAFAKSISNHFKLQSYYINDFILEGGSIHVDGLGNCLVTKACLLSKGRNPNYNQTEIEDMLKTNLGVTNIIWLDHGIYNDETNEHIDNIACFVEPGTIAMSWCKDKNDPQYKYCQDAYNVLKSSTDENGNHFKVIKIVHPQPIYSSVEESKGIRKSNKNAIARPANNRLAASYINYYQGDKFVIVPKFGVPEDSIAYKQIKELYPNKDVIQIKSKEILLGGGNIHCITMQIPVIKGDKIK